MFYSCAVISSFLSKMFFFFNSFWLDKIHGNSLSWGGGGDNIPKYAINALQRNRVFYLLKKKFIFYHWWGLVIGNNPTGKCSCVHLWILQCKSHILSSLNVMQFQSVQIACSFKVKSSLCSRIIFTQLCLHRLEMRQNLCRSNKRYSIYSFLFLYLWLLQG